MLTTSHVSTNHARFLTRNLKLKMLKSESCRICLHRLAWCVLGFGCECVYTTPLNKYNKYVCTCICMQVTRPCKHIHAYTYIHAYIHTYIHIHTCICIYRMHIYIYMPIYNYIFLYSVFIIHLYTPLDAHAHAITPILYISSFVYLFDCRTRKGRFSFPGRPAPSNVTSSWSPWAHDFGPQTIRSKSQRAEQQDLP